MVMQPSDVFLVGGSNPGAEFDAAAAAAAKSRQPGFEPPTENFASAALPLNRRLCDALGFPTAWSLLSENF